MRAIEQKFPGYEIKGFSRTERNDFLITDYTSIKKVKLDVTQPIHNAVFQETLTVENELPLLTIVNFKVIVSNIEALETAFKDSKPLELEKASLKNNTGSMQKKYLTEN